MANRTWRKMQALEQEVKVLYADIAIGATGAPTLTRGNGLVSVVRNSTGDYTITLKDTYNRLMFCDFSEIVATAEHIVFQAVSETVASTKLFRFRTLAAGVATDPANGARILITLELKNSSVL